MEDILDFLEVRGDKCPGVTLEGGLGGVGDIDDLITGAGLVGGASP